MIFSPLRCLSGIENMVSSFVDHATLNLSSAPILVEAIRRAVNDCRFRVMSEDVPVCQVKVGTLHSMDIEVYRD